MKEKISKINKSFGGEPQGDKSPYIFDRALYNYRFRPRVVSIGPYYRRDPRLREIEKFKWQCLAYSLNNSNKNLEDYLEKIPALEQFKECYFESSGLQTDEFLEMMVLDGCFIVELIRFSYPIGREKKPKQSDRKGHHPLAQTERANLPKICTDLLMLQNQIPYNVLEKVFELSEINLNGKPLVTLSVELFRAVLGFHCSPFKNPPRFDYMHLLDLVRSTFIPTNYKGGSPGAKETPFEIKMPPEFQYKPYDTVRCVTKLRRVGIKVNPRREGGSLLVEFRHGVIEMPKIILNDSICCFLENCVALEQRLNASPKCFSVYALCLDCLVNAVLDYFQ